MMKYTCHPSLSMCLDLEQYADPDSCGDFANLNTIECGRCFPMYRMRNHTKYATAQFCDDDTKRAFEYNCDSNCQNCQSSMAIPLNTCLTNPTNMDVGNAIFLRARPCKTIVSLYFYNTTNCTGPVADSSLSYPANSCLDSQMYFCE